MEVIYQYPPIIGPDVPLGYVCLREPSTDLEICLVHHSTGPGDLFSEFRTGLDHLKFLVQRRADLDEWVAHLDALGVAHSGNTEPSYTRNAMLTFRDPTTSSWNSSGGLPELLSALHETSTVDLGPEQGREADG